jgi:MSHA pilin protein MshA
MAGSRGFTLIELIIIIIILGIVSAVAIPRFSDMRTEAQRSTAHGILGAIASTENILFTRYVLTNTTYNNAAVVASANISGGASATVPASSGTGTITLPNGATYTYIYTKGSATSAGSFVPGNF